MQDAPPIDDGGIDCECLLGEDQCVLAIANVQHRPAEVLRCDGEALSIAGRAPIVEPLHEEVPRAARRPT